MLQTQLSPPNSLSDFPCFIFNFVCTAARATFQCQSPDSTLPLYYAALSPSSASALCNRRVEFSVSFPGVFPEFSSLPASSLRHLLIVRCYFVALEIRLIGSSTQLEIVSPHSPDPLFRACRRFTLWLLIFTAWPSNLQQL